MRMCIWCLRINGTTSDEDVYLVLMMSVRLLMRMCIWCLMMNGATSDEDVYLVCDDKRYDF